MSVVIVPDEEEDERYLKGFGECGKMCQRRRRRMRGTWKGLVSVVIVPDEEEDERYLEGFGECGNCAS